MGCALETCCPPFQPPLCRQWREHYWMFREEALRACGFGAKRSYGGPSLGTPRCCRWSASRCELVGGVSASGEAWPSPGFQIAIDLVPLPRRRRTRFWLHWVERRMGLEETLRPVGEVPDAEEVSGGSQTGGVVGGEQAD